MIRINISRRLAFIGLLLLVMALIATVFASTIGASSSADTGRQIRNHSFQPKTLQQMVQAHQLASTVQVLSSQPPSVIVQFPLFPSGVKKAFPKATGVVTIVQGNPAVSLYNSVTVDVSNMPPDTTFTIFYIELANKPFGNVEYVADLHTRIDGSGEASFQAITLVAFAADNRTPVTSQDQSGVSLGHSVRASRHVVLLATGCPKSAKRQHAQRHHFRWRQSTTTCGSPGYDRWTNRASILGGVQCNFYAKFL